MPDQGTEAPDHVVVLAMQGDHRAQSDLWRAHRPWLAAVLLSHKPRELDIEDLMQDVAVKFVSKLHTLRDAESFRPWLRRIAINIAREAARSFKGRGNHSMEEDLYVQDRFKEPGEARQTLDEAAGLLEHAMTLPLEFREPLLLRCVRGLSSSQIAELLDLPRTTVETRLSRARKMLREEWLGRTGEPSPDEHTQTCSPGTQGT
ncbi:MAG: sigma-70 family RNA polymerase sigma factor [Phycisphaerales bacterium]|nr:sigma-70 family RNA polymerase sigma factor [Phycisphaerales bacterium]